MTGSNLAVEVMVQNIYPMNIGAKTKATIDINFNSMFRDGPEVSLNGSPTVSPTTVASWASDPFPSRLPDSIYF